VTAEDIDGYVEHFRQRVLQDALAEASASYWERRAQAFENARPRPGEFHGKRTPQRLQAKYDELTAIAQACRNRAALGLMPGIDPDDEAISWYWTTKADGGEVA